VYEQGAYQLLILLLVVVGLLPRLVLGIIELVVALNLDPEPLRVFRHNGPELHVGPENTDVINGIMYIPSVSLGIMARSCTSDQEKTDTIPEIIGLAAHCGDA
jgi:hypothetical protein